MTTTATVWQPTTLVNSGFTTGQQTDPFAVETADGRILTLWVDDTNNVEAAAGQDVVGRHRDYYLGLDQPFHVNFNVSAGSESRARVAALPDGGLFTVFTPPPTVTTSTTSAMMRTIMSSPQARLQSAPTTTAGPR